MISIYTYNKVDDVEIILICIKPASVQLYFIFDFYFLLIKEKCYHRLTSNKLTFIGTFSNRYSRGLILKFGLKNIIYEYEYYSVYLVYMIMFLTALKFDRENQSIEIIIDRVEH